EMVVTGLTPGRHSLATFHNRLSDGPPGRYEVRVDGVPKVAGLRPTTKAHDDADAACAYVEIEAAGAPVVVTFEASAGGDREVILNGCEIDTPDPNRKAIKPAPADHDGHADADGGSLELAWSSHARAASHDLYFGTDRGSVAAAGRSSPEFRGRLSKASYGVG